VALRKFRTSGHALAVGEVVSDESATRDEILWRVDCVVTWDAPDCALPQILRGSELNRIIGKGAYKFDDPKHFIRIGFELNAPDEETAARLGREGLLRDFETIVGRHGELGFMPDGLDLHPDRIVLDRLAVRQVVVGRPSQGG
jgi:hypothetical protein